MAKGSSRKRQARKQKANRNRDERDAERATRKQQPVTVHSPDAHFLLIPGELRNSIYRLLLLCQEPMIVTPEDHKQPDILRTCSQIRREATKIFIIENEFYLRVFNCRPIYPQREHWVNNTEYTLRFDPEGKKNLYENLEEWLKRAFKNPATVPRLKVPPDYVEADSSLQGIIRVVGRYFELLDGFEKMNENLTFRLDWEMVRSALWRWGDRIGKDEAIGWDRATWEEIDWGFREWAGWQP